MRRSTVLAAAALVAASATSATAEWRWVDEPDRTETYIYEERVPEPEYVPESRTVIRETYTPAPVVVTDREYFREGNCDVTRTYFSNGTSSDDRVCSRLVPPHVYILDRIGRRLDHLRGYGY